jgi:hypothetical protein
MTGDQNDIVNRLKSVLPAQWFGDVTPIFDALLNGLANAWAGLFQALNIVGLQARIATATGVFLDIASTDYFGAAMLRRGGESDADFSARLRSNLLAGRATRSAVSFALDNLTGRAPAIFEPLNATDTGGYNRGTLGYGTAGGYGSYSLPFQFFVTAYRPNETAISNAGGYGNGPGGYNTAPMFYADFVDVSGTISDADIYAAAAAVLPAGYTGWMNISN